MGGERGGARQEEGAVGAGSGEAGRTGTDGGRRLAGGAGGTSSQEDEAAQDSTPTRGSGGAEVPFLGKTQHPQGWGTGPLVDT